MEFIKQFTGTGTADRGPAPRGQMKAVVWHGRGTVTVDYVQKPKVETPTDIIVRVTASAISPGFSSELCDGEIPGMEKGQILGREAVGIVDDVGSEIVHFKKGDRVVISSVIACGECSFCKRLEFSACNCTNESREFAETYGGWAPAAVLGSTRLLGDLPGTHAEYVRVPFGDVNCYKVPNAISDEKAVLVAETAAAGLHAVVMGQVKPGDIVVVWGLGPVGLMAGKWAKLMGAKCVVGVDYDDQRLKMAYESFAMDVLDRTGLSSADVTQKLMERLPERGADVTIDACGQGASLGWMQRVGKAVGMSPMPSDVMKECMMVTRKYGHIGVIGDYTGYADTFPIGHVMMKHLTLRAGQTPVQYYFKQVFDAIEAGELDPSKLISHQATLDEAAEVYGHVCKKDSGFLKVLIRPSTSIF